MSGTTEAPTRQRLELLAGRCEQLSRAVADWQMHEFTKRIPAEPDRDADLVLSEVSRLLTRTCKWTYDDEDDAYYTECGNAYQFNTGTPEENHQVFCGYCGGAIEDRSDERPVEEVVTINSHPLLDALRDENPQR